MERKKKHYDGTVIPLEFEPIEQGKSTYKLTERCLQKLIKRGVIVSILCFVAFCGELGFCIYQTIKGDKSVWMFFAPAMIVAVVSTILTFSKSLAFRNLKL